MALDILVIYPYFCCLASVEIAIPEMRAPTGQIPLPPIIV
jgi:hypothetical protein